MLILIKAILAVIVLWVVFGLGFGAGRKYQNLYLEQEEKKEKKRQNERRRREAEKAAYMANIYNRGWS